MLCITINYTSGHMNVFIPTGMAATILVHSFQSLEIAISIVNDYHLIDYIFETGASGGLRCPRPAPPVKYGLKGDSK